MPYTISELNELDYYQNLKDEDEQRYLMERERLVLIAASSGSAYDGSLLTRDQNGTIMLFENPYTGELYEDETTTLYIDRRVDQLKDDSSIDEVIDREFTEL